MDNQQKPRSEEMVAIIQAAVEKQEKERDVHWTVKIFGGALVSVCAIVVIGAFQSAFQGINDCQKTIQQQSTTILSKDEYNGRIKSVWEAIKDCNAQKSDVAALKERVKILEQQLHDLNSDFQKTKEKSPK